LKLEGSVRYLHHSLETFISALTVAACVDDPAVAEHHLPLAFFTIHRQDAVQARVFDHLDGVEDAHCTEVSREGEVLALEVGFGSGHGFQVGAACAPDGFESARDVDAFVELFGFEETVVSGVEVFAFDVQTGEGEALAGGFFGLFLRGADLAGVRGA